VKYKDVRDPSVSVNQFCRHLKTELFCQGYYAGARCRHNFCYKTCANTNIVITLHYITLQYICRFTICIQLNGLTNITEEIHSENGQSQLRHRISHDQKSNWAQNFGTV